MINRIKLTQCQFDAVQPNFKCLIDSLNKAFSDVCLQIWLINRKLKLLGIFKRNVELAGNRLRKATTTNAKHLRTLDATVIHNSNIGCATTDVGQNGRKVTAGIDTKHRATHRKRLSRHRQQVKIKLTRGPLQRTNVHHRGKCGVDLDGDVLALEANWVANLVAINMDADDSAVYQLDFDVLVTSFPGDFLLGASLGAFLNFLDDKFHFIEVEGFIWLRALIADSLSDTLYQFASNADYRSLSLYTSLRFGVAQGHLTVTDNAGNVSDSARMHGTQFLVGSASSNNL